MAFRHINLFTAFDILGVDQDITSVELKKIHKELSFDYHPDKYTEEKGRILCQEYFKSIQNAFEIVSWIVESKEKHQAKTTKRRHDCCEKEDERTAKRQRVEVMNPASASSTSFFNNKQLKIKYYFKDEWQIQFNSNFFIITSDVLRKLNLQISAHRKNENSILVKLPPHLQNFQISIPEELDKEFGAEISDQSIDKKNRTQFIISDKAGIFSKMLEFIIKTFQLDQDFASSLRTIINTKWYEGELYNDQKATMTP